MENTRMSKWFIHKGILTRVHNRGGRHTGIEREAKLAGKGRTEKKKKQGPRITYTFQWSKWQGQSNPNKGLLCGLEPVQITRVWIGVYVGESRHWVIGQTRVIQGIACPAG